jgi:hypothetical protein
MPGRGSIGESDNGGARRAAVGNSRSRLDEAAARALPGTDNPKGETRDPLRRMAHEGLALDAQTAAVARVSPPARGARVADPPRLPRPRHYSPRRALGFARAACKPSRTRRRARCSPSSDTAPRAARGVPLGVRPTRGDRSHSDPPPALRVRPLRRASGARDAKSTPPHLLAGTFGDGARDPVGPPVLPGPNPLATCQPSSQAGVADAPDPASPGYR